MLREKHWWWQSSAYKLSSLTNRYNSRLCEETSTNEEPLLPTSYSPIGGGGGGGGGGLST